MSLLKMKQKITYWTVADSDVNSSLSWNAGITIKARWVRKDGIITDDKGNDRKTEFIVYAKVLIPKRSMVVLEDQEGVAEPPDGARKIMGLIDNPSMTKIIKHVM